MESTNRMTLSCRILQRASLLKSRAEGLQQAGYRPTSTHKTFELRTATGLARLWRDQGKRTEARVFSRRSTAGSPKASTRLCCKTPRRR
jgi:hypothetical protein